MLVRACASRVERLSSEVLVVVVVAQFQEDDAALLYTQVLLWLALSYAPRCHRSLSEVWNNLTSTSRLVSDNMGVRNY